MKLRIGKQLSLTPGHRHAWHEATNSRVIIRLRKPLSYEKIKSAESKEPIRKVSNQALPQSQGASPANLLEMQVTPAKGKSAMDLRVKQPTPQRKTTWHRMLDNIKRVSLLVFHNWLLGQSWQESNKRND